MGKIIEKQEGEGECRGCEGFQFYSYLMAQEALTMGLTMTQAKGRAMAAIDQADGSGSGILPPLPGTEYCTHRFICPKGIVIGSNG